MSGMIDVEYVGAFDAAVYDFKDEIFQDRVAALVTAMSSMLSTNKSKIMSTTTITNKDTQQSYKITLKRA